MIVLAVIVFAALSSGCSHHQPAAVEEHSVTPIKRQMNSDGSYDVRSGDTLYAIAFNYGMDPRNLAKWNGISSPYVIYPGQKLRLLALPASSRGTSGVKISTIKTPAQVTTKTVSSPKPSTQTKSPPASGTSSTTKTAFPVNAQASNTADPESWKWPTRGRVVRSYVAGDPARNGLDIAGKEGQTIVASSGGQVVYSGNGLIGYGELIIIKHSEKMLSAYAHNKIRLVKEGEQVSAGQKIAEMGRNSGNKQLLHFEIRAQGKPVDPLTYLPKQ
jgi:lipoprotein NlpD